MSITYRATTALRIGGFVALLASLPRVAAQLSEAKCLGTDWQWAFNSRGQSPCLVAAYLDGACQANPSDGVVDALNPGEHYLISKEAANDCFCNTVFYSVIGACAFCQDDQNSPWSTWKYNCTRSFEREFPMPIPAGTSVPSWAYLDVVTTDNFNATVAEAFATSSPPPDSSAPGPSSASGTPSGSTASTTAGTTEPPNTSPSVAPESSGSKKSNVGPIVGGVVGGIGGLALILAALALWLRHRRSKQRPPSAAFRSQQPPIETTPWTPPPTEEKMFSPTPPIGQVPEFPANAKVYNPDDPSTFPSSPVPSTVMTDNTRNSQYDQRLFQQQHQVPLQPVRYSGIAEI